MPAYFRKNANDEKCNWYCMISKYAFEKLDQQPEMGPKWWKKLGYEDDDGNNIMKQLMNLNLE